MAKSDPLLRNVEAARGAYDAAWDALVSRCEDVFLEPDLCAPSLVDIAEEYGAAEALARVRADPSWIGELAPGVTEPLRADLTDPLEPAIEALLDARDKLDLAKRDYHRANPPSHGGQEIAILGRDFVLDTDKGELRSVDDPNERYLQPEIAVAKTKTSPAPSLADALERDGLTPPAPAQTQGKTGRTR